MGCVMQDILLVGIVATDPADHKEYAPLAFGYLSAYLKKHLPGVRISMAPDAASALKMNPDIIGISSATVNFQIAKNLAEQIKEHSNIPVLIGGVHISMLPDTLPEAMDIGVLGEGENTLLELMRLYMEQGSFPAERLSMVKGICFWHDGVVKKTPSRPLIENLDTLPHPDRDLLLNQGRQFHIVASRGCPFDCAFCSSKVFWKKYRAFGVQYVAEEIDQLVQGFGARKIHFFDDLFVSDRKRLRDIAKILIDKNYPDDIEFSCTIRAEQADEELFEILAGMGIRRVTFGAESNSKPVLEYLKGKSASPKANQHIVDLAHKAGIEVGPSFIKGAPNETGEDMMRTYEFILTNIRDRKINYFEIHNLTPFPGTKIWEEAKTNCLVNDEMDWEELRRPWEKQFMNRKIPKASFYFFEKLTQKATEMLKINNYRLVCIVDAEDSSERAHQFISDLEATQFFDFIERVDFQSSKENTLPLETPLQLNRYFQQKTKPSIFCYCRLVEPVDPDAVKGIVWQTFLSGADAVFHSGWRHFTPVTESERSLKAFSQKGFEKFLQQLKGQEEPSEKFTAFIDAGLHIETYRPEEDPFVTIGKAESILMGELNRDFKLGDLQEERDRRLRIIEDRIYEKSEKLPFIETRNRKLRESRAGRFVSKIENKAIKRLLRFVFDRD